ncbi:hypothetical protein [Streptomyces sp. fd1-xmd]|uniref:hypothetical protein n=1 Tax=Streptomyces sp. fd1-xmd TaxID=1812480 RepID=UPI00099085C2|nr:hypothetical protein [Streptomyces sp. fd1-xmd]AQT70533.1 hypothetical protein B1K54_01160 [Streptomyces sp. fd1-xmd]
MTNTGVSPYWELTFDAEGHVSTSQRDAMRAGVRDESITDLIVFSHGWNNSRSIASALYQRFFEPVPELLDRGESRSKVGYVGIIWPSMRWTDEPIPAFSSQPETAPPGQDGTAAFGLTATAQQTALPRSLDGDTRKALVDVFPGRADLIEQLAELLNERPEDAKSLDHFFRLAKSLVEDTNAGSDTEEEASGQPAMLADAPRDVFRSFLPYLTRVGVRDPDVDDGTASFGRSPLRGLWNGAREMLRQTTYYQMKQRAGQVGRFGLGPILSLLQEGPAAPRVHLVGHSFGARLVSFALKDLPDDADCVQSLTLLQAAFSHFSFAESLPHDKARSGELRHSQKKVDGPIVACFSKHDDSVGTFYPIASLLKGDDAAAMETLYRWGALGHDGIQGTNEVVPFSIAVGEMTPTYDFPSKGYVNMDAASVVCRGGPPSGAHSDICHPELASVVLSAAQVI